MGKFEKIGLGLIVFVVVSFGLMHAKGILMPFMIGGLLSYISIPLIRLCEEHLKIPRFVAIVFLTVVGLLLVVGLGAVVTANIKSMAEKVGDYQTHWQSLVLKAGPILSQWGVDISSFDVNQLSSVVKPLFNVAGRLSKALVDLIADSFLILIIAVFLMTGKPIALPKTPMWIQMNEKIRSYLVTKVVTSGATGLLTALILLAFGVDLAFLFGLLAFLLNFIPTVGSLVAVFLPIPIVILSLDHPVAMAFAVLLPGVVQFTIGNVIEPKMMGDSLDLHPVTILLTLMFWGFIWGIPGMLLATPLTVMAKVALSQSRSGFMLSEWMAGRSGA